MNIPIIRETGVEADDIIATLSQQAEAENMLISIVSLDSDYYQLLSPKIRMLRMPTTPQDMRSGPYVKFTPFTDEDFREKYDIEPSKWTDVVALKGDSSDNIPGVAGIGVKSAFRLLEEWVSLDAVLAHVDDIQDTRSRNCLKKPGAVEAALLSKELVLLRRDLRFPGLEVPLDTYLWRAPPADRMTQALKQLDALEMYRTRDRLVEAWTGFLGVKVPDAA